MDDLAEALAQWSEFLEGVPPNTTHAFKNLVVFSDSQVAWFLPTPRLRLFCTRDDGFRSFERNRAADSSLRIQQLTQDFLVYTCRDCGFVQHSFALRIVLESERQIVRVMKVGQFPPFGLPVPARIGKLLGKEDLELYRKGKRAEAQGLGIAAAAYFRRIVENQWKKLVQELRDAAVRLGLSDLGAFDAALKETQFSSAVRALKDAVPAKLLVLNQNPLTLLHAPLSVELHSLTDEQCMEQAADIRMVLTAMLENIAEALADHEELTQAVNRLTQARAARPPSGGPGGE